MKDEKIMTKQISSIKPLLKILSKFVYNFLALGLNLDVLLFFANVYIYLRQWDGEIELKN